MKSTRVLKEALLALGLFAFGLIGLPILIYVVGQRLIGEYEAGLMGFYDAIGDALLSGNGYAWVMVLSPYLGIMLLRLAYRLRRRRQAVS